ncbi:MAG: hypothetical protein IT305_15225 [Chloroflexi bacterium]|nr:hypothetical protein [Chloroflexota bacterium]
MARQTAKVRSTSKLVATKPACAPLHAMYSEAIVASPRTWTEVEDAFVVAMEGFDANVASGMADIGDLQNGKGDFFNDLLALLLENCAGVELFSRGGVPGFVFANHNLDLTYPNTGVVRFTLEAKAVGTPRHQLSPRQKPIGRAGSADLGKRVKEVAFKTIDLKAEYGRIMAARGQSPDSTPGGNLTTWLRSVPPSAYLFIAARVVSHTDFEAVIGFAHTAAQVQDGVGVFCFGPESESQPTTYRKVAVPIDLSLDRVLYRACQDLVALKAETPIGVSAPAVGPPAEARAEEADAGD